MAGGYFKASGSKSDKRGPSRKKLDALRRIANALGSQRWFRLLPVATAVTISAFALVEIYDTFFDFRLGRAHGLLSVGAVKLATAVGELQAEAAIVLDEDGSLGRAVIEVKNNASSEVALRRSVSGVTDSAATSVSLAGPPQPPPQSPPRQSFSPRAQTKAAKARALLVGRRTTMVACAFALVACIVEIVRDLEAPGRGRHGAALLTLSELVNHWCRLFPATEIGNGGNNSGHLFATALQRRRVATMGVAVPAALYAAEEVLAADWRHLGAYHAAAVLAAAQFTENFYRACLAIGVPRIAVQRAQIV
jgi:hypothetical protein